MLDEIIDVDDTLFPTDEDVVLTISFGNTVTLVAHAPQISKINGRSPPPTCSTCVKHEIIKEELLHSEHRWFNTGFKNVYMLTRPLYMRHEETEYQIFVVSKPLAKETSIHDLFVHRAALTRFVGCKTWTPPRLSQCCAAAIGENLSWNTSKTKLLGLPPFLVEYLNEVWKETAIPRSLYDMDDIQVHDAGIFREDNTVGSMYITSHLIRIQNE